MQGLLRRIWQWIQEFFGQLFGKRSPRISIGDRLQESGRPLTDTDYEFLFSQLLEGIAHGWHEGRVLKYFEDLGKRGKPKPWVAWLERFGKKAIASSSPNLQLAARMIRLGELAQSFRETEMIGKKSNEIGQKIYSQEAESGIWEYEGPDIDEPIVSTDNSPDYNSHSRTDSLDEVTQTLTIEELRERLQQNATLDQQLAPQLGTESSNPEQLKTQQEWFEQGLQQANQGDLEGAIASWDKALEINPSLSQGWHNRGSALVKLGKIEEAITSYRKALEIEPRFRLAQSRLDELELSEES